MRPPAAFTNTEYISNAGTGHDRFGQPVRACIARNALTVSAQQPFVQSVGQHQLRFADAEVRGAFARERRVVRIVGDVFGRDLPDRVDDGLRTSTGVLVHVQPQRTCPIGRTRYVIVATPTRLPSSGAGPSRTSIDRACASSPSSRASVVTVGARFSQPLPRHSLNRRHAHEICCVKASTESRRAVGRQHVVRSDGVVARDLCGVRSHENRPGRPTALGKPVVVAHQMLGSGAIGEIGCFVAAAGDDDAAMARERFSAGPVSGICMDTARATLSASWRLVVISSARACGSCSACAMRSAAIHSGFPLSETMTISVGPA